MASCASGPIEAPAQKDAAPIPQAPRHPILPPSGILLAPELKPRTAPDIELTPPTGTDMVRSRQPRIPSRPQRTLPPPATFEPAIIVPPLDYEYEPPHPPKGTIDARPGTIRPPGLQVPNR